MGKFRACVAVYGILVRDGKLLLMRRAGSGHRDGELSLPAGHLDGDEDAISGLVRELSEELGITVRREDCELATLVHSRRETPADDEYLNLYFRVSGWQGKPAIQEPAKCTELAWVDPSALPADVVNYITLALRSVQEGQRLATIGWD